MTRIILLDIDGVLVQPLGYRAALRATVQYFIGSDLEIEENLIIDLEKRGIISEWDMAPLLIASFWNSILHQQPMQNLPDDVSAAAREIQSQRRVDGSIYVPVFDLVEGQYPAQTAYEAGLFSSIPERLRKNLLTETRDVHKSHPMRILQHFTLGSEYFIETYNLQADFETESFLLKHDRSNLDVNIRAALQRDGNKLVAFTARPSRPPREITDSLLNYAPEAELALELVGLNEIPLIAFGKLEYIAAKHGLDPAKLIKPSPFQALAATLAAWTEDELFALEATCEWRNTGVITGGFNKLPRSFELIVVEDTMGGVRSTQAIGEIFDRAGFDVAVRVFGLTSGSAAKAAAFEVASTPHYEKWEALIKQAKL